MCKHPHVSANDVFYFYATHSSYIYPLFSQVIHSNSEDIILVDVLGKLLTVVVTQLNERLVRERENGRGFIGQSRKHSYWMLNLRYSRG